MTRPYGKNKKCGLVSPLEMKAEMSPKPESVPAATLSGHLISGHQGYITTITFLPFSSQLSAFSFYFAATYQSPASTLHTPRETTSTDPEYCHCPCVDRAFRTGEIRSKSLHIDGLALWGKF